LKIFLTFPALGFIGIRYFYISDSVNSYLNMVRIFEEILSFLDIFRSFVANVSINLDLSKKPLLFIESGCCQDTIAEDRDFFELF